jgi:GTP pyrophosphokinase
MVRFAKCCNPLPGDPISGYITRGRGVTVHESRCPHLERVDPARRVDLEWDVPEGQLRPARIQVVNSDRSGALADMAAVLKKRDINILEADVKTTEEQQGIATFTIEVKDASQLTQVLRDLKKIKGVSSVKKLGLE